MKAPKCALCGRVTLNPAVFIGREPIGPKCARRAGLLAMSKRAGSKVMTLTRPSTTAKRDGKTMDLFAGVAP